MQLQWSWHFFNDSHLMMVCWIDYFFVASNRLQFINLKHVAFSMYIPAFIFWCEKIHCFWKIELKTKNSLQMHVRNKITTNFSHIESISIFFTVWSKFYQVKNYISFLYEIENMCFNTLMLCRNVSLHHRILRKNIFQNAHAINKSICFHSVDLIIFLVARRRKKVHNIWEISSNNSLTHLTCA